MSALSKSDLMAAFQRLSIEDQRQMADLMNQSLSPGKKIDKAIREGEEAVMALLSDNQSDPSASQNRLIDWACREGKEAIVKKLLADQRVNPGDNQNAALKNALCYSRDPIIRLLLAHSQVDPTGTRASFWAQEKGLEDVRLLLANPNYVPDEFLLNWACSNNQPDVLKQILANPKVTLRDKGKFLLEQACQAGQAEIVQALVESPKVDLNAIGNQALVLAAINGHVECVQCVLPKVDPAADGQTAIRLAGNAAVATMLLADGRVDPAANHSKALLMASIHGKNDVVEVLLADGRADPTVDLCACVVWAHSNHHDAVEATLLRDPRVNPYNHQNYNDWFQDERRLTQRCVLTEHVTIKTV